MDIESYAFLISGIQLQDQTYLILPLSRNHMLLAFLKPVWGEIASVFFSIPSKLREKTTRQGLDCEQTDFGYTLSKIML